MWWPPILGTAVGGVLVVVGQVVFGFIQGMNQKRSEQRQRREHAVKVLAEAYALLTDANPQQLGLNARRETFQDTFKDLRDRWQLIRIPLLTLHVGHPSEEVRDLARQLQVAIAKSLTSTQLFINDLLYKDSLDAKNNADENYMKAMQLLDQLKCLVRS